MHLIFSKWFRRLKSKKEEKKIRDKEKDVEVNEEIVQICVFIQLNM